MMDAVFYFSFYDSDTGETLSLYGFNMAVPRDLLAAIDVDALEEITEELESEYGVHDWSSRPTDQVFGIGYTTYEVPELKIPELMTKWREHFISVLGEEYVTEVVRLDAVSLEDVDDEGIYQAISELL